jgi:hypothetical protein
MFCKCFICLQVFKFCNVQHTNFMLYFFVFFCPLLLLQVHFIILLLLSFQPITFPMFGSSNIQPFFPSNTITFSLAPPSWSLATLIIQSSSLLFQHVSLLLHPASYVDYIPLGAFISNLGLKYLSNLIPLTYFLIPLFVVCLFFLTCLNLYFPLMLLCANLQVQSFQFPT